MDVHIPSDVKEILGKIDVNYLNISLLPTDFTTPGVVESIVQAFLQTLSSSPSLHNCDNILICHSSEEINDSVMFITKRMLSVLASTTATPAASSTIPTTKSFIKSHTQKPSTLPPPPSPSPSPFALSATFTLPRTRLPFNEAKLLHLFPPLHSEYSSNISRPTPLQTTSTRVRTIYHANGPLPLSAIELCQQTLSCHVIQINKITTNTRLKPTYSYDAGQPTVILGYNSLNDLLYGDYNSTSAALSQLLKCYRKLNQNPPELPQPEDYSCYYTMRFHLYHNNHYNTFINQFDTHTPQPTSSPSSPFLPQTNSSMNRNNYQYLPSYINTHFSHLFQKNIAQITHYRALPSSQHIRLDVIDYSLLNQSYHVPQTHTIVHIIDHVSLYMQHVVNLFDNFTKNPALSIFLRHPKCQVLVNPQFTMATHWLGVKDMVYHRFSRVIDHGVLSFYNVLNCSKSYKTATSQQEQQQLLSDKSHSMEHTHSGVRLSMSSSSTLDANSDEVRPLSYDQDNKTQQVADKMDEKTSITAPVYFDGTQPLILMRDEYMAQSSDTTHFHHKLTHQHPKIVDVDVSIIIPPPHSDISINQPQDALNTEYHDDEHDIHHELCPFSPYQHPNISYDQVLAPTAGESGPVSPITEITAKSPVKLPPQQHLISQNITDILLDAPFSSKITALERKLENFEKINQLQISSSVTDPQTTTNTLVGMVLAPDAESEDSSTTPPISPDSSTLRTDDIDPNYSPPTPFSTTNSVTDSNVPTESILSPNETPNGIHYSPVHIIGASADNSENDIKTPHTRSQKLLFRQYTQDDEKSELLEKHDHGLQRNNPFSYELDNPQLSPTLKDSKKNKQSHSSTNLAAFLSPPPSSSSKPTSSQQTSQPHTPRMFSSTSSSFTTPADISNVNNKQILLQTEKQNIQPHLKGLSDQQSEDDGDDTVRVIASPPSLQQQTVTIGKYSRGEVRQNQYNTDEINLKPQKSPQQSQIPDLPPLPLPTTFHLPNETHDEMVRRALADNNYEKENEEYFAKLSKAKATSQQPQNIQQPQLSHPFQPAQRPLAEISHNISKRSSCDTHSIPVDHKNDYYIDDPHCHGHQVVGSSGSVRSLSTANTLNKPTSVTLQPAQLNPALSQTHTMTTLMRKPSLFNVFTDEVENVQKLTQTGDNLASTALNPLKPPSGGIFNPQAVVTRENLVAQREHNEIIKRRMSLVDLQQNETVSLEDLHNPALYNKSVQDIVQPPGQVGLRLKQVERLEARDLLEQQPLQQEPKFVSLPPNDNILQYVLLYEDFHKLPNQLHNIHSNPFSAPFRRYNRSQFASSSPPTPEKADFPVYTPFPLQPPAIISALKVALPGLMFFCQIHPRGMTQQISYIPRSLHICPEQHIFAHPASSRSVQHEQSHERRQKSHLRRGSIATLTASSSSSLHIPELNPSHDIPRMSQVDSSSDLPAMAEATESGEDGSGEFISSKCTGNKAIVIDYNKALQNVPQSLSNTDFFILMLIFSKTLPVFTHHRHEQVRLPYIVRTHTHHHAKHQNPPTGTCTNERLDPGQATMASSHTAIMYLQMALHNNSHHQYHPKFIHNYRNNENENDNDNDDKPLSTTNTHTSTHHDDDDGSRGLLSISSTKFVSPLLKAISAVLNIVCYELPVIPLIFPHTSNLSHILYPSQHNQKGQYMTNSEIYYDFFQQQRIKYTNLITDMSLLNLTQLSFNHFNTIAINTPSFFHSSSPHQFPPSFRPATHFSPPGTVFSSHGDAFVNFLCFLWILAFANREKSYLFNYLMIRQQYLLNHYQSTDGGALSSGSQRDDNIVDCFLANNYNAINLRNNGNNDINIAPSSLDGSVRPQQASVIGTSSIKSSINNDKESVVNNIMAQHQPSMMWAKMVTVQHIILASYIIFGRVYNCYDFVTLQTLHQRENIIKAIFKLYKHTHYENGKSQDFSKNETIFNVILNQRYNEKFKIGAQTHEELLHQPSHHWYKPAQQANNGGSDTHGALLSNSELFLTFIDNIQSVNFHHYLPKPGHPPNQLTLDVDNNIDPTGPLAVEIIFASHPLLLLPINTTSESQQTIPLTTSKTPNFHYFSHHYYANSLELPEPLDPPAHYTNHNNHTEQCGEYRLVLNISPLQTIISSTKDVQLPPNNLIELTLERYIPSHYSFYTLFNQQSQSADGSSHSTDYSQHINNIPLHEFVKFPPILQQQHPYPFTSPKNFTKVPNSFLPISHAFQHQPHPHCHHNHYHHLVKDIALALVYGDCNIINHLTQQPLLLFQNNHNDALSVFKILIQALFPIPL